MVEVTPVPRFDKLAEVAVIVTVPPVTAPPETVIPAKVI